MSENTSPDAALLDQAALYAIDALPADEAARFRVIARDTPSLVALVSEYESVSALLAETLPPVAPPPDLRARILAAVAAPAPIGAASPAAENHSAAAVFVPWGVAAALAVSLGLMWLENQEVAREKSTLRDRVALLGGAQKDLEALRVAAAAKDREAADLRRQIARLERRSALAETLVAPLTSKLDASYLAVVAWDNAAQEGILEVSRLPAAEPGKGYQLWIIDPNNAAPVSGGAFTVPPDGSATIRFAPARKVSAASAFAVSVEPAGGSAIPQGPIVLSN